MALVGCISCFDKVVIAVFLHGLLATGNTVDTSIVTSSTEVYLSIILILLTLCQSLTQVAVLEISYYAIKLNVGYAM